MHDVNLDKHSGMLNLHLHLNVYFKENDAYDQIKTLIDGILHDQRLASFKYNF